MKDGIFVSIISVRAVMLFTEIPLCLIGPYGRLQALEGDVTITSGRPALSSVPSNKLTVHLCPIYLKAMASGSPVLLITDDVFMHIIFRLRSKF